jgi:hypothetical protein
MVGRFRMDKDKSNRTKERKKERRQRKNDIRIIRPGAVISINHKVIMRKPSKSGK